MHTLSVAELALALRDRRVSSEELTRLFLGRIARLNPGLNAFITIDEERALASARAADARLARGESGPLTGIPIAHKDLFCARGWRTTCGSRMLDNFVAPYDAHIVERLEAAGTVHVGKANMDEFAMGSANENSHFGPVRNPWDATRVPGGSSGGSAAAVSAALVPAATGSDTGGSIRQPAALCGVVGVKPTYGYVSRFGLIAFASSRDQIGPFTTTVDDAALLLDVIGGHDPHDSTSIPGERPSLRAAVAHAAEHGAEGLRVGRITDLPEGADPDVQERLEAAFDALRAAGATIVDVQVPAFTFGLTAYYLIAPAEASSNLARYDGVRYGMRVEAPDTNAMFSATRSAGFGDEVKRRIMLGTYALSAGYYDAYYGKALKVRRLIHDDFERAYATADVLLTPASPSVAFEFGSKGDNPLAMYLCDTYTIPSNLAGHPGMSVPFGTGAGGLPVGVQVLAGTMQEPVMFRAATVLEQRA